MGKKRTIKKGGNCGCNSQFSLLQGGSNNPYYNPLNNYNSDPNDPSVVMSVRMQPNMNSSSFLSGGKSKYKKAKSRKSKRKNKSKNNKSKRRTNRKMKGGAIPMIPGQNENTMSMFNTVLGSSSSANIINTVPDNYINGDAKINPIMPFI
jgi:hypothetical protein